MVDNFVRYISVYHLNNQFWRTEQFNWKSINFPTSTFSSFSFLTITGRTEISVKSACKDILSCHVRLTMLTTYWVMVVMCVQKHLYDQHFATMPALKLNFKSLKLLHATTDLSEEQSLPVLSSTKRRISCMWLPGRYPFL